MHGWELRETAPHVDIRENINGSLQYLQEIRQMYDKLAAGAVENYQTAMEAETQNNTTREGSVSRKSRMTDADIQAVQSIGRISVNQFSAADIKATERFAQRYWQEMGVKSPFFRAWFGDWRVNDQTKVQVATQKGDARGVQRNEDTGWDIQVSGQVFAESKHFAKKNKSAIPYLPYINDIVEKAILLDSYGIDVGKAKSQNSLLMHSLYAVADIGHGPELLKLYIEEMNDPNSSNTAKRAYQLQNIEKASVVNGGVQGNSPSSLANTTNAIRTVADLFAAVKQKDSAFQPKPASKVVNWDGTPLEVYHGTTAQFWAFNGGAYFTDDYMNADGYASGERIVEAYLSMKNPLIIDCKGAKWDDLDTEYGSSTQEIVGNADNGKFDGVIFENINDSWIDDAEYGDISAVYYPFKNTQIKSATDNLGTFDGTNADIRYKKRAAAPQGNAQNKNRAINGSPLTRRSVKQRSVGSTHVNMSSTAAAEILGIANIAELDDSVKDVVAKLGELFVSVDEHRPVLGFKRTITASNLEGSLVALGILKREGTSGSAYRYDNGHALRISNHSANADNFVGDGEHLSVALFEQGKMNDFVEGNNNVIEAVFRRRYLDNNPEALKRVIHDIAHFIAEGEYHDTAGALRYHFSGTESFKEQAKLRMAEDAIGRESAENKGKVSGKKKSVDNSAAVEENGVTQKSLRSGQHDNGRVREGVAEAAESGRYNRGATSGSSENAQALQGWQNLSQEIQHQIKEATNERVNNSPNSSELYYYILSLVQATDDTVTAELYDRAVDILTEKIYNDAVNLHPVLFEDKWKIMGGSISDLRRSLLDSATEKGETETKVSGKKRGTTLSDREVLEVAALRMDTSTLSEGEQTALQIFKDRLAELRKLQIERERLGSLWHEQQFGSGDRSEAPKTLNRMHVLDGQVERAVNSVLSVEDKQILRDVLQKAREYVKEQSVDHYRGILERRKDRSTQAQLRQKLHSTVHELSQLLLHGDKNHHVPEGMKKAVAGALDVINSMDAKKTAAQIAAIDGKQCSAKRNKTIILWEHSDRMRWSCHWQ